MNILRILNFAFLISFLGLSACATGPLTEDAKYIFPEFQEVDSITNNRISGWQSIDSRSLIIEDAPSNYYLVILRYQVRDLNFAEDISVTSTGTKVMSKFDCVSVARSSCFLTEGAPIERIYKLDNREAVNYAKNVIRN